MAVRSQSPFRRIAEVAAAAVGAQYVRKAPQGHRAKGEAAAIVRQRLDTFQGAFQLPPVLPRALLRASPPDDSRSRRSGSPSAGSGASGRRARERTATLHP
eukprot:scaffold1213_cov256-Pinguiococcus_pyrenoidosus.AAC.1